MTEVSIHFSDSNEKPIYVQVDPWAGLYMLKKGESVEIVAPCDDEVPSFSVDENKETRLLTLVHASEYFIVKDGKRLHWTEYSSNCL